MKAIFRTWMLVALRWMAQQRLAKIQPKIVGVTGSSGKTTAKELMAEVLGRRLKVKKSPKNLNTEFGAIFTILDRPVPRTTGQWLFTLVASAISLLRKVESYDILVMEMGVDKPGDMDETLKVFRPDHMVFLNVKNEHLDDGQFPHRKAIFEEKSKACYGVNVGGWSIINMDDKFVKQLDGKLPEKALKVGCEEGVDLEAQEIRTDRDGLHFNLVTDGEVYPVHLPNVLGECHVTLVLSAIAVGFLNEIPWKAIEVALKEFQMPPGRMNRIAGLHDSMIIDSSYNASEDTMKAGLDILSLFHGRKIAALGSMNELGELTEAAHLRVGKYAAKHADMLVAVGKHATLLAEGVQMEGLSASMIHVFQNSMEAGEFLQGILERNDVMLVKGSQNNVRMEHVVKACMKYPEEARQQLVRQEPYWLKHL